MYFFPKIVEHEVLFMQLPSPHSKQCARVKTLTRVIRGIIFILSDVSAEFSSNGGGGCFAFVLHYAAGPHSGHHAAHRHVWLGR